MILNHKSGSLALDIKLTIIFQKFIDNKSLAHEIIERQEIHNLRRPDFIDMDSPKPASERTALINNHERIIDSEYFEISWKLRLEWIRRRVVNFIRKTTKTYRKKKEYMRFLTAEERRLKMILFSSLLFSMCATINLKANF